VSVIVISYPAVATNNFQELIDKYNISQEDVESLRKGTNVSVFSYGSAVVNSGISFQFNGDSKDINEVIEHIPPEALGEILRAIADLVARRGV
jgi:uncharacterized FlaG/YvyC family protein